MHAREWILVHGKYNSLEEYSNESSSHLAIVSALRRLNQYKLANDFFNFKELRKEADYDIVKIISEDDVKKAYGFSNAIFSSLN